MTTTLIFAQNDSSGSGAFSIILLVGMMGLMYLVLIRPQQKKQREQASFTNSVEVGDKVVTSSGLYGTVNHIDDESVHLEVDTDIVVRVAKAAVLRSQDTPPAPARSGGLLGGLLGGGAAAKDEADDAPTTRTSGRVTNPKGKDDGGEGSKRSKR